MANTAHQKHVC